MSPASSATNSGTRVSPPVSRKRPISGYSKLTGAPSAQEGQERQPEQQPERHQHGVERLPGRLAPAPGPARQQRRPPRSATTQRDQGRAGALPEHGQRDAQAAVVEEDRLADRDAVARMRQRLQDREVPEQELEQQRDVADRLDVDDGEARDQPVGREPRKADDEAEDGRQDDAERRDQQRVEQADPERPAVGRHRAVVDQREADVEARGPVQEAEARRRSPGGCRLVSVLSTK